MVAILKPLAIKSRLLYGFFTKFFATNWVIDEPSEKDAKTAKKVAIGIILA